MSAHLSVVGIGEALFDRLDGRVVLGGAPVNVAVHAHQLLTAVGGRGVVCSRVGDDELGRRLIKELTARGLDVSGVQTDPTRATGTVEVTLDGARQPTYAIARNVAWDALEWTQTLEWLATRCGAVCFGTLAQRSETTRRTLHRFLKHAGGAVRLFDPNLRADVHTDQCMRQSLEASTVLKLNVDELERVCAESGIGRPQRDHDGACEALMRTFGLRGVALTRGARGTLLYMPGQRFEGSPGPFKASPDADHVGAGDACCAGLLAGMLLNWAPERTLDLANRMGAFVASRHGATPALESPLLGIVTRGVRVAGETPEIRESAGT